MAKSQKAKPELDPTAEALKEIFDQPVGDRDSIEDSFGPKKRGHRLLWILLLFLFLAAGASFGGFFAFTPKKQFSDKSLVLTIDGPKEASSGDTQTWTIHISNKGNVDVKKADLNLQYPTGFSFVSAKPEPSNEFNNAWSFTTIKAGSEKTVTLKGNVLGNVGSELTLHANVNYQPTNFSSDFSTETDATVKLTTSTLDVTIKAPTAATSGQNVQYVLTVKNTSTTKLERVRLEVDLPSGLSEAKKEPEPSNSGGNWDQSVLDPGKEFAVTISGKLTGNPESQSELKARIGVVDADGTFRTQKEQSALILFLQPTLNLTLSVEQSGKSQAVNAGDKIQATLTYSNDSDNVVSDVTLTLSYAGQDSAGAALDMVDRSAITASKPFKAKGSGSLIQWTKTQIKDLERLTPGARGSVDVTMTIPKSIRSFGTGKNLSLNVVGGIHAEDVGGTGTPLDQSTDTVALKMNTELRLAVEGRYYSDEGAPVGSGPLPPEVGSTTTYQINWFVTNTLNDVSNATVKATLPEDVTFVGASAGLSISYDPISREVRWSVAKIEAGTGQTLPTLTGTFTVSIVPTVGEVGQTKQLLGKTTLVGTDAFSGATFTLFGGTVATDLPFDTNAQGKGTVVPAGSSQNVNINAASILPESGDTL